jgi:hypothetical protein
MASLIAADENGNLLWNALNPDGSAAPSGPTTAGTLRPGSKYLYRAAARGSTLVVAGEEPHTVYVYDNGGQGPPVLLRTITAVLSEEHLRAVALSPDGQSLAIGKSGGETLNGVVQARAFGC